MSNKHWATEEKETWDLIAEKAAQLTLRGIGVNARVKALSREFPGPGVTLTKLISLQKHPKYLEVINKNAEEIVNAAKTEGKLLAAKLIPSVYSCLKKKIEKESDVRACALVINVMQDQNEDEGQKQAQQLQIIMPGASAPLK